MKIDYDKEADALYIYLRKGKVSRSKPEGDDFVIDVDKEGRIIGLEVLNASRYMKRKSGKLEVGVGDKTLSLVG